MTQIANIRNEIGNIIKDPIDIKRIIKEYYEQCHAHIFLNLEWTHSSKDTICQNSHKKKTLLELIMEFSKAV